MRHISTRVEALFWRGFDQQQPSNHLTTPQVDGCTSTLHKKWCFVTPPSSIKLSIMEISISNSIGDSLTALATLECNMITKQSIFPQATHPLPRHRKKAINTTTKQVNHLGTSSTLLKKKKLKWDSISLLVHAQPYTMKLLFQELLRSQLQGLRCDSIGQLFWKLTLFKDHEGKFINLLTNLSLAQNKVEGLYPLL